MVNLASFWKTEACGQTVLPDRSVLKGQKLLENAKIQKSNATFWVIFKQCVWYTLDYFQTIMSVHNKFWFDCKSSSMMPTLCNIVTILAFILSLATFLRDN